jgi:hypothetical protein
VASSLPRRLGRADLAGDRVRLGAVALVVSVLAPSGFAVIRQVGSDALLLQNSAYLFDLLARSFG